MNPRSQQIAEFIRTCFPSIWSLELLLHLKRSPWSSPSRQQLVTDLRASDAIVSSSVATLIAAGLIADDGGETYRYAPASDELAHLTDQIEDLYLKQPNVVRRLIVTGAGNLAAFADAFKLRKD